MIIKTIIIKDTREEDLELDHIIISKARSPKLSICAGSFTRAAARNQAYATHYGEYHNSIEGLHSRGQHLCKFIGTKEIVTFA